MKILILNIGSSSLKYSLYNDSEFVKKGNVQKIGSPGGKYSDHAPAIKDLVSEIGEVNVVGHRIVHGGEIRDSCLIDSECLDQIKKYSKFAPLHNPPEINGIEICQELMPDVKQVAIFDTAFHSTIPKVAYLYAIPYEFYEKDQIRKYGFHGTSHKFVSKELKGKVITCHLGNGCSIAAIKDGKSVDTSMGLTPLEGLMMGTRSGDIDAGAVMYLMHDHSVDEIDKILNKKSGFLGISGFSNDIRDITSSEDEKAKLALDMFCYRIQKYIGSYAAALNGVDTIVFTAGIGENVPIVRKKILDNLTFLGIEVDEAKNKANENIITTENSKVKVMVIPTNEELLMAQECIRLGK
jgi:acetate kinase